MCLGALSLALIKRRHRLLQVALRILRGCGGPLVVVDAQIRGDVRTLIV